MISWEEELLARLGSDPIQEVVIVVRIEIVLDCVSVADGNIRILRNIRWLCSPCESEKTKILLFL